MEIIAYLAGRIYPWPTTLWIVSGDGKVILQRDGWDIRGLSEVLVTLYAM